MEDFKKRFGGAEMLAPKFTALISAVAVGMSMWSFFQHL